MKTLVSLWPDVPANYRAHLVSSIVLDSRKVVSGSLFIALKGLTHDAREFIHAAIDSGAAVVLAEKEGEWQADKVINGTPIIVVNDLAQEVGYIAARFFDDPSLRMDVLAVTGTNGKTSVANLLADMLTALKAPCGVLGTLGNGMSGDLKKSTHTTLDAYALQEKLAEFLEQGARAVALEASSHGLVQGRLNGTHIDVALFTNLSRDHLDYHGNMQAYAAAKGRLFTWPALKAAVINIDDPVSAEYIHSLHDDVQLITYSCQQDTQAAMKATNIRLDLHGVSFVLEYAGEYTPLRVPLLGRFNVSNIMAAMGGLLALGYTMLKIQEALAVLKPVRGRMQSFMGDHPTVVVDYAHTPDALTQVLKSLREHASHRVVTVFGCGGDRDKGKRPLMGEAATTLSDVVFITTDNPRTENPEDIAQQILKGCDPNAELYIELDRSAAIISAISMATRDDIVLVAGKGHEDYQEINNLRHYFDDAAVVREALSTWGGV